jgi:hypothetical protein
MIRRVAIGQRSISYDRGTETYSEGPGSLLCDVQFLPSGEGTERAFMVLRFDRQRHSLEVSVEFNALPDGRFKNAAIKGTFEEGVEFIYEVTDGKLIITSLVLDENTHLATEMSNRSYS